MNAKSDQGRLKVAGINVHHLQFLRGVRRSSIPKSPENGQHSMQRWAVIQLLLRLRTSLSPLTTSTGDTLNGLVFRMVIAMVSKADIFEDTALALESWTKAATSGLTAADADLIWTNEEESFVKIRTALTAHGVEASAVQKMLEECFRGLAVTFFTMLDGGTSSAGKGRVYLVDERGNRLGEGLHDEFVSYLIATGRMK